MLQECRKASAAIARLAAQVVLIIAAVGWPLLQLGLELQLLVAALHFHDNNVPRLGVRQQINDGIGVLHLVSVDRKDVIVDQQASLFGLRLPFCTDAIFGPSFAGIEADAKKTAVGQSGPAHLLGRERSAGHADHADRDRCLWRTHQGRHQQGSWRGAWRRGAQGRQGKARHLAGAVLGARRRAQGLARSRQPRRRRAQGMGSADDDTVEPQARRVRPPPAA